MHSRLALIVAMSLLGLLGCSDSNGGDGNSNSAPVAEAGSDFSVFRDDTVDLDGSASSDLDGDPLTFRWSLASVAPGSLASLSGAGTAMPSFLADAEGTYVVQLIVNDGMVDSPADTITVSVTLPPPLDSDGDGLSDTQEMALGTDPNDADTDDDGLTDGEEVGTTGTLPTDEDTDGDGFSDGDEVAGGFDPLDENDFPGSLPPDPADIAPRLEAGIANPLGLSTEFLYTGSDPIQTGVAPDTIDLLRAAAFRGRVIERDGDPLGGVTVSIHGHPEFGQTISRSDGMFDLVVNGGGPLVVDYAADGFLPAQRLMATSWQAYVIAPDVALIPVDSQVTTVDLSAAIPMQLARGSQVTDGDGTRQATLMIPQGTSASLVMPNGSTQALTTVDIRATEYTVGENGPAAMPAPLPATSGYTYAVELSVDEALSVGASEVRFDQPLTFYVENFLGFPVGGDAPVGYYDRAAAEWKPEPNGRVISIVAINAGLAEIDVDGDALADGGNALADLGVTDAERMQLATAYAAGQSLWRVQIEHFSPYDINWPTKPPDDAETASQPPTSSEPQQCLAEASGSIIECQNQVLGERVALTGVPHRLNYRSSRVAGRSEARTLEIPIGGSGVPVSLKRIELSIEIAGQIHTQSFNAAPNQSASFTWDGLDAYGRSVQTPQQATVRIGYVYDAVYANPALGDATFGLSGGDSFANTPTREEAVLARSFFEVLGTWNALSQGLGGWTLDSHHAYDPISRTVYRGDGSQRPASEIGQVVTTVRQSTTEELLTEITIGSDGVAYVGGLGLTSGRWFLDQIDPDGVVTRIESRATGGLFSIAAAPDGSVYIGNFCRLERRHSDGSLSTLLGDPDDPNACGFSGDGGPAAAARASIIEGIVVADDGTVYFTSQRRVRRIGADGIVMTVAGNGDVFDGDGRFATEAGLGNASDLAFGSNGELYILTPLRLRRLTPDGILDTIAGDGSSGDTADGMPARGNPLRIAGFYVDPDDSILMGVADCVIRKIDTTGVLSTLAGSGCDFSNVTEDVDGQPARSIVMGNPQAVAAAPDGSVWILDGASDADRVLRVAPPLPGLSLDSFLVSNASGSELYEFDRTGRHLRTLDALMGSVEREFRYGAEGLLIEVEDAFGNLTTIERDANGDPMAIVGPFGERTTLGVDADGYLTRIVDPASSETRFVYSRGGLLTESTDPLGGVSNYTYDTLGRLERAEDRADGAQDLLRVASAEAVDVDRTTASGLTTTYGLETLADGSRRFAVVGPDLLTTEGFIRPDGTAIVSQPDGSVQTAVSIPDSRLGIQSPLVSKVSFMLPSGMELETLTSRNVVLADEQDPTSLVSSTEVISVAGETSTIVTDVATHTVTLTSPEGRDGELVFDEFSRMTRFGGTGMAPTTIEYGATGDVSEIVTGVGDAARVIRFLRDGLGRVSVVTDPLGLDVSYTHDAAGRRLTTTRPDGEIVFFDWDANGNLISLASPGRPAWQFAYDARDLLVGVTPPTLAGTGPTFYDMDIDGRLMRTRRPNGDVMTLSYDEGDRVEARTFSRPGETDVIYGVEFDAAGRVANETAPNGLGLSYEYDGPIVLASVWAGPVSGRVSIVLGADFRPASQSINDASPVDYEWDLDGLLMRAGDLVIERDAVTGTATGATLGVTEESITRDEFGGTISQAVTRGGGSPSLYRADYTRDKLGRIVQSTEVVEGVSNSDVYTYDVMGRLVGVSRNGITIESYAYDLNGNRVSETVDGVETSSTYDVQDRLIARGTVSYAYDANGAMTQKTSTAGITAYGYDGLGMLSQASLPDGRNVTYLIDSQGHRMAKSIDGARTQGFLYGNSHRVVAELDAAGAVASRFVYASGLIPVSMMKGGEQFRIVTDDIGSVRLVVNSTTGNVVQRLDYDAFGNVLVDTNPGFQPFGFAAGLYDVDTGLVRFGVRDYDPASGRFMTRDPLLLAGGAANFYVYAGNDPVNVSDPLGLRISDAWVNRAVGVAVGAVEGLAAALDVTGIPKSIEVTAENWAQALNAFGVINYEPYSNTKLKVIVDLIDTKNVVDQYSLDFNVPRFCAMLAAGFVVGGGAAAALERGAAKGASHLVANPLTKAPAGFVRGGGPRVLSRHESNQGISKIIASELKPAANEAQSGGLHLIRHGRGADHIGRGGVSLGTY